MPDDLYSLWLKVSPGPRPPDHYALLGLPRFCENLEQIEAAAQRQLDELDRHSLHNDIPRRDACHRMMNEVARARVALTNPQKRAAYDQTLEPGRIPPPPAPPAPTPKPAPKKIVEPVEIPQEVVEEIPEKRPDWVQDILAKCRENPVLWIVPAACLAVIIGAIIVVHITRQPPPPTAVAIAPLPKPNTPAKPTSTPSLPGAVATPAPSGVDPKALPATIPATSAAQHEPPAPVTPPTPPVVVDKPKSPEPPATADANLKALPSAEARAKSEKLVEQIYGDDLAAAKTPKAKGDLARKMLGEAGTLGDHDADRFVLLGRCGELAVEGGDIDTAMAAVGAAGREFQIDALKIKARTLNAFAESGQNQQPLAKYASDLIDQAIHADRYDIADYVVHADQVAAKAANDSNWLQQVDARRKEVGDAQAEFEKRGAGALHAKK